jgi:hypothetical protein
MLWQGQRESENVEDARGSGGGRIVLGGGIGTVILVVLYLLLGGDPQALFNSQQAQLPQTAQYDSQAPRDEASKFVGVVLKTRGMRSFGKCVANTKNRGWCCSPI